MNPFRAPNRRRFLILGVLAALVACQAVSCRDRQGAPVVDVQPTTAPASSFQPFSFVLASDPHVGVTRGATKRFSRLARQVSALKPAFVLVAGDITHGLTERRTAALDRRLKEFSVPVRMVPGNHDVDGHESLATWRRKYGRDYYAFTHNNCEFICLNSMTLYENRRLFKTRDARFAREVSEQWKWLEKSLAAADAAGRTHVFICLHVPPFVRNEQERAGYRNMPAKARARLLGLARKHGVRTILAGHTHRTRRIEAGGLTIYTVGGTYLPVDLTGRGFYLFTVEQDRIQVRFVPLD